MIKTQNLNFIEIVAQCFEARSVELELGSLADSYAKISSEADFDLFLWNLGQRLKLDTEEVARQLGERWVMDLLESGVADIDAKKGGMLQSLDSLLSQTELLRKAPIMGAETFKAVVMSRSQDSLRACCLGARRCCSFLEGVARGIGKLSGESVRYIRQPQSATMVELLFRVIPQ